MDRNTAKRAIAGVVLCGLAIPAMAQETKPVGLSVRAGLVFPTSGYGRNVGNTWLGVGAEFKVKDMGIGSMDRAMMSHLSVSLDWYGKGEASSMPILVNWVGNQNEMYYSAGAGFAFTRDRVLVAGIPTGRNKTSFAYSLGVGYNFSRGAMPFFVEGRYHGSSNSRLNALGAYVGVRL